LKLFSPSLGLFTNQQRGEYTGHLDGQVETYLPQSRKRSYKRDFSGGKKKSRSFERGLTFERQGEEAVKKSLRSYVARWRKKLKGRGKNSKKKRVSDQANLLV